MNKTLFTISIILFCYRSLAQSENRFGSYLKAEKKYLDNEIDAEQFLIQGDSLMNINLLRKGVTTTDSLIAILKNFKTVAWSKERYSRFKPLYYKYLCRNSQLTGRGGEAIFFAGKYSEELKKLAKYDAFEVFTKINYLSRNENFDEIVKVYNDNRSYLQNIWINTNKSSTTDEEVKQIFQILYLVAHAYLENNNIDQAKNIYKLCLEINSELQQNLSLSKAIKVNTTLMCFFSEVEILIKENDITNAKIVLQKIEKLLFSNKDVLGALFFNLESKLSLIKLNYYLLTKDITNGIRILEPKHKNTYSGHYENMFELEHRGHFAALENDFKKAYNLLSKAITLQKKENLTISKEINDLLYSHTVAEAKHEEVELAKIEEKNQRDLNILIITIASLSLMILYHLLNKEKQNLRKVIKEIKETANIEIQEVIVRASKEERNRIGQDLHDGLSGTMAGILYRLEDIKTKSYGTEINSDIDNVYNQLKETYSFLRNKSHVNFNSIYDTNEDTLEESIYKIVNSALKNTINKEIEIDKNISIYLDILTRVEILRIVQEALTNIIKHAKRVTEINIFLYKNEGNIYLEIGNNGIIYTNRIVDGIGIKSIKNRAKSIGGDALIEYDSNGFKIEIKLPNTLLN